MHIDQTWLEALGLVSVIASPVIFFWVIGLTRSREGSHPLA